MYPPKNAHRRPSGKNMSAWIARLGAVKGMSLHTADLTTDALEDIKMLRSLRLPCYDHLLIRCDEFLKRFSYYVRHFAHDSYFLTLYPLDMDRPKLSLLGFSTLEAGRSFINKNIGASVDRYMLYLSALRPNVFGGSLVSDGAVIVAEIAPGFQTHVSHGSCPVDYAVLSDLTISAKYSTDDPLTKELLWKAISSIARPVYALEDDIEKGHRFTIIRNRAFLVGYFEFAYLSDARHQSYEIVFFDVKLKKSYWQMSPDSAACDQFPVGDLAAADSIW